MSCVPYGILADAYGFAISDHDPLCITRQEQGGAQDFDLVHVVDVGDLAQQLDQVGRNQGAGIFQLESIALFALGFPPGKTQSRRKGEALLPANLSGAAHDRGQVVHSRYLLFFCIGEAAGGVKVSTCFS